MVGRVNPQSNIRLTNSEGKFLCLVKVSINTQCSSEAHGLPARFFSKEYDCEPDNRQDRTG